MGHFEGFCRSIDISGRFMVGYHSTEISRQESKKASKKKEQSCKSKLGEKTISRPYGKCMNLFIT